MIKCLSERSVDFVKTQSWQASKLRPTQFDFDNALRYYRDLELTNEDHRTIKDFCVGHGLKMLTTCFDIERIDFLKTLEIEAIKVASSDSRSFSMIKKLLDSFQTVIISTGATTRKELDSLIRFCDGYDPVFLHCTSIYPCPLEDVNMARMLYLRDMGVRFGFSDHTIGTQAGKFAISLGAEYLEKHFTLSRYLPGKDQKMSTLPDEFAELVKWAELVERMRGSEDPPLSDNEVAFLQNYVGKWGDNA